MSNSGKRLVIGGVVVFLGLLIALAFRKADQSAAIPEPQNTPSFKSAPGSQFIANKPADAPVAKSTLLAAENIPDDPFSQRAIQKQKPLTTFGPSKETAAQPANEIPSLPREQPVLDGWEGTKPAQHVVATALPVNNNTQLASTTDSLTRNDLPRETKADLSLRPLDLKSNRTATTDLAESNAPIPKPPAIAASPLQLQTNAMAAAAVPLDQPRVDPLAPKVTAHSESDSQASLPLLAANAPGPINVAAQPAAAAMVNGTVQHTIRDGDTLPLLAQHYLGSAARANELFLANQYTLKDPELLPIGAILQIPNATTAAPYVYHAVSQNLQPAPQPAVQNDMPNPPQLAMQQNTALNRPPTMDRFSLQNSNAMANRANPGMTPIDYQPIAPKNGTGALPGWPPADLNSGNGKPAVDWPASNLAQVGTGTPTPKNNWGSSSFWNRTNSALNRVSGTIFGSSTTLPETTTKTYLVGPNDSWEKLAKKFYGDEKQAGRLLQANTDRLSGMVALRPGMVLIVPPK